MVDVDTLDRLLRLQAEVTFAAELELFRRTPEWTSARAILVPGCGNAVHLQKLARAFPDRRFIGSETDGRLLDIARRHHREPNLDLRAGGPDGVVEEVDLVLDRFGSAPAVADRLASAAVIVRVAEAVEQPPVPDDLTGLHRMVGRWMTPGRTPAPSERPPAGTSDGSVHGERIVIDHGATPRPVLRRWLEAVALLAQDPVPEGLLADLDRWLGSGDELRIALDVTWSLPAPSLDGSSVTGRPLRYVLHDRRRGDPTIDVVPPVSDDDLDELDREGFLSLPDFLADEDAVEVGRVIDDLMAEELAEPDARPLRGNGYYVKRLIGKHPVFERFLLDTPALDLARAMLGPQVRVELDCRVAFERVADAGVPWHIHLPGVVTPTPRWFSHPHSLHVLVYLDPVTDDEGSLCVLPGSHHRVDHGPDDRMDDQKVELQPRRGDAVAMHGNLWHRTVPSSAAAARRRVLFLGYTAAWVEGEARTSYQPARRPEVEERRRTLSARSPELTELLGDLRW